MKNLEDKTKFEETEEKSVRKPGKDFSYYAGATTIFFDLTAAGYYGSISKIIENLDNGGSLDRYNIFSSGLPLWVMATLVTASLGYATYKEYNGEL